jgi:ribosome-associated toxin RatA of RatAB toxin-antitoxin module
MWFDLETLDADYPYRAKHRFVMTRELDATPDRLFAILADVDEWPRWFPDMSKMAWISPEAARNKPHAVRRANTSSGDVIEHFVAWDEGKRLAFYAERMSTPLVRAFFEDYVIEPVGTNRSRLTWIVAFEPRLPFRPLMFAIRPSFAKMFDSAADALVTYVAKR